MAQKPQKSVLASGSMPPFTGSRKVYEERDELRVPAREISLDGGAGSHRVYDPSGPENLDIHAGLPALRKPWDRGPPRAWRPQLQPDALRAQR